MRALLVFEGVARETQRVDIAPFAAAGASRRTRNAPAVTPVAYIATDVLTAPWGASVADPML